MKRMIFLWLFLLLLTSSAVAVQAAPIEQAQVMAEPFDERGGELVAVFDPVKENPPFSLLIRVTNPEGTPVPGLGCSFDRTHTTDRNGECLLEWDGSSRRLALFNRYADWRDPGYRDTYNLTEQGKGVTGQKLLTLVWAHITPLEALEQRERCLELLVTDHLGQPKDGLSILLSRADDLDGQHPVELLFSGQRGRYVWCDLRTSRYIATVSGSGERCKFTYTGGRQQVELQLRDPAVPKSTEPFLITELDKDSPWPTLSSRFDESKTFFTEVTLRVVDQAGKPVQKLGCDFIGNGSLIKTDERGEVRFSCPYRIAWELELYNGYHWGNERHYQVELQEGFESPILTIVWEDETPQETIQSCTDRVELTLVDKDGKRVENASLWFDHSGILEKYRTNSWGPTECPVASMTPYEPGRYIWLNPKPDKHTADIMVGIDGVAHYISWPFEYKGGVLSLELTLPPEQPPELLQRLFSWFGAAPEN